MEKYINTITNCDSLKELKKIASNSIATVITDPPYNYEFIGKNWDDSEIKRRTEHAKELKSVVVKNIPYGSGLSGGVRNKRWYQRVRNNIVDYSNWVETWGRELYRVLKPGGFCLVFNSNRTVAQVQVALENVGFYARDILIWKRNTGIPKGLNVTKKMQKLGYEDAYKWKNWNSSLYNMWEGIVMVQKPLENNYINTLEKYNVGVLNVKEYGKFQTNIFDDVKREKAEDFNCHVTIKPLDLIERLITITTPINDENIVLDPFAGSGTTCVAAKKLGFKFIGFEINPEYVSLSKKRLSMVKQ